jgi:hypothetical protein
MKMKPINAPRTNLAGKDFPWQLLPNRPIPFGKENVFNDIAVLISGKKALSCLPCHRSTKAVNFKNNEKMIQSEWELTADPFDNTIQLKFEPAHPGLKILGVGAQYAVDSNVNGFQFTANLRVIDDKGTTHSFENDQGKTINKIIRRANDPDPAVFLGAEADPGENIVLAEFTVAPRTDPAILGFFINSLRLRIG